MEPSRRSTAWKRLTVGTQVKSWIPPEGSVRLQVTTTRSSSSFTERVPDMRGFMKTQIAGTELTSVRAASCNWSNRPMVTPPPRPPRPPPPPAGGAPKAIDPVVPTEKESQLLPEKGNERPRGFLQLVEPAD